MERQLLNKKYVLNKLLPTFYIFWLTFGGNLKFDFLKIENYHKFEGRCPWTIFEPAFWHDFVLIWKILKLLIHIKMVKIVL